MSQKLTLLLACLCAGSSLVAQKQPVAPPQQLDEVVVTANKVPQKQSTTGKVITVIDKLTIEKNSGKSVAQLLNDVAGVTVNGANNNIGTNQTLYMRGAASGRTLLLIDGIPVNDPSMITNDFDLNQIALNNVERIEICRGAQSTVYGSDAIAGVINIITLPTNIQKPIQGNVQLMAGSFGTVKANTQITGKINKLTYSARVSAVQSNGFSSAYDSTGKKAFDKDAFKGTNIYGMLQYALTNQFSIKAFTQKSYYRTDADGGAFTDKQNFYAKHNNLISGAGFKWEKAQWQLIGNYQYLHQTKNFNDNADVPGATTFSTNDYASTANFAELYAKINVNKQLSWLIGADYRHHTMNNQYNSVSVWGPYKSSFNDTAINISSIYSSLFWHTGKWHTELGGRLNKHSKYGSNATVTFNPSYNFSSTFRVFGNVATSFKAPSLYQLYADINTGFPTGNPDLKPEKSTTLEIGLQTLSPKFSNRVVLFHRNISNGIDYNYINYRYFNYVSQKVNGLEYEFTYKPIAAWQITGNYTYLAPKETSQNRLTNQDTITYNYLLRRAKHQVNVSVGWQASQALFVSINGKYVGKRYDVGGYMAKDEQLDAYAIFGMNAIYDVSKCMRIFADIQNIFNAKFFDIRGYNSLPISANMGIKIQW